MKIRGRRRCESCGRRWSYYRTDDPACPDCGSLESVGIEEERRLHTDAPVELDLADARPELDERPLREVADDAGAAARRYLLSRGFVDGGTLRPLDATAVAAAELRHAADRVRRSLSPDEAAERYFRALLAGADRGDRPDTVPPSMRGARGLAAADVAEAYRTDLLAWLEEHPDPAAREVLGSIRDHERRIAALDGDVAPAQADRLVRATRAVGEYLRDGDETALTRARDLVGRLGQGDAATG